MDERAEIRAEHQREFRILTKGVSQLSGAFSLLDLAEKTECSEEATSLFLANRVLSGDLEEIRRGRFRVYQIPNKQSVSDIELEKSFLAQINTLGGSTCAVELALLSGKSLQKCKGFLERMSDRGFAEMNVNQGNLSYSFPAMLDVTESVQINQAGLIVSYNEESDGMVNEEGSDFNGLLDLQDKQGGLN